MKKDKKNEKIPKNPQKFQKIPKNLKKTQKMPANPYNNAASGLHPVQWFTSHSLWAKIGMLSSALVILFVLFAFVYYYNTATGALQTVTVTYDSQSVKINVTGVAIRDEFKSGETTLIKGEGESNVGLVVSSGDYVSAKQEIGRVFDSHSDYEKFLEYEELLQERSILTRLENFSSDGSDIDAINLEITALLRQYTSLTADSVLTSHFDELLQSLAYQIDTKADTLDFVEDAAKLDSEIASLESTFSSRKRVEAPAAGYFVGTVDGMESAVDYSDVSQNGITGDQLDELLKGTPKADSAYLGKIVGQNNWYFSFSTSAGFAGEYFKRGNTISVSFPAKGINDLSMVVAKKVRNGDDVCVTCRCATVNDEIFRLRVEEAVVTANATYGFKVASNALVTLDNVTGVYVNEGGMVVFKPVNVMYSGVDYSIVESMNGEQFARRVYDEKIGDERYFSLLSNAVKEDNRTYISSFAKYTVADLIVADEAAQNEKKQAIEQSEVEETAATEAAGEEQSIESTTTTETTQTLETTADENESVVEETTAETLTTEDAEKSLEGLTIATTEPNKKTAETTTPIEGENLSNTELAERLKYFYRYLYSSDNRVLSDYDVVIVRGRNLKDGKFLEG